MRRLLLPCLVLALLAGCGDDGDDRAAEEETTTTTADYRDERTTTTATDTTAGGGGAGATELVARDFQFDPAELSAPSGATTIEVSNEGGSPHTFTIDDLGVDQEVQPGSSAPVEVTVPESGEAVFYCRFHGSPTGGMRGTLSPSGG
jgi:plastocyanin